MEAVDLRQLQAGVGDDSEHGPAAAGAEVECHVVRLRTPQFKT
jgi:hypothetical protein